MSLKAFHVVFITAACLLALGFGVYEFKAYWSEDGQRTNLLFGIGSLVLLAALIIYERYFLRKLKDVDYV
jgi:hypothetical protein